MFTMHVIDFLKKTDKTHFSFELLPPLKGNSVQEIFENINPLLEFKPPFINITYHRPEVVYKQLDNGLLEKHTIRKRPGTVAIAAAIKQKYDITVVPHLTCGGFTQDEIEDTLIDLQFLGIEDILVLRGDPEPGKKFFKPVPNGHQYATSLVQQISNMNQGRYLDENLLNASPTHFSMGVAGYPEKHIEAPNKQQDLMRLKEKIDAGAQYIVTQMFFDNEHYFEFVNACRDIGINVPIVPGIKPISNKKQLRTLPYIFNIDIPEALTKELLQCKTPEQERQVGIEWAIQQSRELIEHKVPVIHYYTMGKAGRVYQIAKTLF